MADNLIINGVLYGVSAVLFNNEKKVLMLLRKEDSYKSGWEFVKGGVHVGESKLSAALREIREEAGNINIELIKELPKIYQVDVRYRNKNYSWVNKSTFVFFYLGGEVSVDNREHSKHEWMSLNDALELCWVEYGSEILLDAYAEYEDWNSKRL